MDRFLEYIVLHEKDGISYSKDCVLLLTPNNLWDETIKEISDEDLYTDGEKFGKENEAHVTLLYGLLTGQYKDSDVEEILSSYTKIHFAISGIGIFEHELYDVVKFDIVSEDCSNINDQLKKLPYKNDFPNYEPHMTLAYVKKGLGNKYKEDFGTPLIFTDYSTKVKLSKSTGEKIIFDLTDNLIQQEITSSAMIASPPGDYSFYQKDKEKDI